MDSTETLATIPDTRFSFSTILNLKIDNREEEEKFTKAFVENVEDARSFLYNNCSYSRVYPVTEALRKKFQNSLKRLLWTDRDGVEIVYSRIVRNCRKQFSLYERRMSLLRDNYINQEVNFLLKLRSKIWSMWNILSNGVTVKRQAKYVRENILRDLPKVKETFEYKYALKTMDNRKNIDYYILPLFSIESIKYITKCCTSGKTTCIKDDSSPCWSLASFYFSMDFYSPNRHATMNGSGSQSLRLLRSQAFDYPVRGRSSELKSKLLNLITISVIGLFK